MEVTTHDRPEASGSLIFTDFLARNGAFSVSSRLRMVPILLERHSASLFNGNWVFDKDPKAIFTTWLELQMGSIA